MKNRKDFLGLDGFYWWFGVVENRIDPKGLGRCQVRIYGAHSENYANIPSEDLPWAHPIHSLNNQSFSTPKEGDCVFGFFVDGKFAQQPVMMGIVPVTPIDIPNPSSGFSDNRTTDELSKSPKKPIGWNYSQDGMGATVLEQEDGFETLRNPLGNIGYPSNSNLARNENITDTFIQTRRESLVSVNGAFGTSWKEPFPAYSAQYPYNKVLETESGHIQEFDDTPGAERIHTAHRSGTFEEIYPSGTKVEKIVKNNYKIVLSDDHLYVNGKVNITVDSHANIKVVGNINLEGQGDLTAGIAGDVNFSVGGDFKVKAQNIYMETDFEHNVKASGAVKIATDDALHLIQEKLNISSGDVLIQGTQKVDVAAIQFNVMSPLCNFGPGITNLTAIGVDSNGDAHALNVLANGTVVTPFVPETALPYLPSSSGLGDPPTYGDPTIAPEFIETTPADRAGFFFDSADNPTETKAYIESQIKSGVFSQKDIDAGKNPNVGDSDKSVPLTASNTSIQNAVFVLNNDCGSIEKLSSYPNEMMLSSYFSLGSLTGKAPCGNSLKAQRGLTAGQIACNLKLLAMNSLDRIKQQYPSMFVTNAFRYPEGETSGRSQHEIGQAADIQFQGASNSDYYNIALWIRDNVPYDQLLLEYKTTGSGKPWIHISYNKDGNRTTGVKIATFMNNSLYKPYLVNLNPGKLSQNTSSTSSTTSSTGITTIVNSTSDGVTTTQTTTQVAADGTQIADPIIVVNKSVTDNPAGSSTAIIDSATQQANSKLAAAAEKTARSLVENATKPYLTQLSNSTASAEDISSKIESSVLAIATLICKEVHNTKKLVGDIKRNLAALKKTLNTALKNLQKSQNTSLSLSGIYAKVMRKLADEATKKIEQEIQALRDEYLNLIKLEQEIEAGFLKGLHDGLNSAFSKIGSTYRRIMAIRLNSGLASKINNIIKNKC